MRSLLLIIFVAFSQNLWGQIDSNLYQDNDIKPLLKKLENSRNGKLSKSDSKTYIEIAKKLHDKSKFEESDFYLSKVKGWDNGKMIENVNPDNIFEKPKKIEVKPEIFIEDKKFIEELPQSYENVSADEMKNLTSLIDVKLQNLIKEREQLIEEKSNQSQIDSKDRAIKILTKEKQIVDLTIQRGKLIVETNGLKIEKKKLRNYLIWSVVGIALLILTILVLLQRKTIKVQDKEIHQQFEDISKKNAYLEHAAKIIRHDMHSGINTYMPRGIKSLESKISSEDIKNLKIDGSIRMIKEGLQHTQKVYKSVYEFTNLVKNDTVMERENLDIKELLTSYLSNSSYKNGVEISDLGNLDVNATLFCNAVDNLIKNGLKYNDSDEKLVKIYKEGKDIVIQDNGRGFTQNQFQKIINTNRNNPKNNFGLGLNICLAILKEHGFSLTCEKNDIGTKIKIII